MVSIIITTYKEPKSLPKAIEAFLNDIRNSEKFVIGRKTLPEGQMFEILVVGPDKATAGIAEGFSKKYPQVKYLEDQGRGKPAA